MCTNGIHTEKAAHKPASANIFVAEESSEESAWFSEPADQGDDLKAAEVAHQVQDSPQDSPTRVNEEHITAAPMIQVERQGDEGDAEVDAKPKANNMGSLLRSGIMGASAEAAKRPRRSPAQVKEDMSAELSKRRRHKSVNNEAEKAEAAQKAADEAEATQKAAEEAEATQKAAEEAEATQRAAEEAETTQKAAQKAEATQKAAQEAEAAQRAAEEAEATQKAAEEAEAT